MYLILTNMYTVEPFTNSNILTVGQFSQILPIRALSQPMLLNAFLACGARHLASGNSDHSRDEGLRHYKVAANMLKEAMQDSTGDLTTCATVAVVLNVYELMCEMEVQNHTAKARELIKECSWDARTNGVGAACFWFCIELELLQCIRCKRQLTWEPDEWGLDMDFTCSSRNNDEMTWFYRMVYIIAKITNFYALEAEHQDSYTQRESSRLQQRCDEWERLSSWCDAWISSAPSTMQPIAYLQACHSNSSSMFPTIWMIRKTAVVAQLFYHTARILLARTKPALPRGFANMSEMEERHAREICGIIAHMKDRCVYVRLVEVKRR